MFGFPTRQVQDTLESGKWDLDSSLSLSRPVRTQSEVLRVPCLKCPRSSP